MGVGARHEYSERQHASGSHLHTPLPDCCLERRGMPGGMGCHAMAALKTVACNPVLLLHSPCLEMHLDIRSSSTSAAYWAMRSSTSLSRVCRISGNIHSARVPNLAYAIRINITTHCQADAAVSKGRLCLFQAHITGHVQSSSPGSRPVSAAAVTAPPPPAQPGVLRSLQSPWRLSAPELASYPRT